MQVFLEGFVGFVILVRGLGAWCPRRVGASQTTLVDEPFGLPRVGLILDSVIVPCDHSVQRTRLLRVVRPRTEARANRYLVFGGDARLESIRCISRAARREVIPMD